MNKGGNLKEVFREEQSPASVTEHLQIEEEKIGRINYWIIDTIDLGDTDVMGNDTVLEIMKSTYAVKEGISQIFFCFG